MKRTPVNPSVDKKVFTQTADKTKAINVKPVIMRGGTRL